MRFCTRSASKGRPSGCKTSKYRGLRSSTASVREPLTSVRRTQTPHAVWQAPTGAKRLIPSSARTVCPRQEASVLTSLVPLDSSTRCLQAVTRRRSSTKTVTKMRTSTRGSAERANRGAWTASHSCFARVEPSGGGRRCSRDGSRRSGELPGRITRPALAPRHWTSASSSPGGENNQTSAARCPHAFLLSLLYYQRFTHHSEK